MIGLRIWNIFDKFFDAKQRATPVDIISGRKPGSEGAKHFVFAQPASRSVIKEPGSGVFNMVFHLEQGIARRAIKEHFGRAITVRHGGNRNAKRVCPLIRAARVDRRGIAEWRWLRSA